MPAEKKFDRAPEEAFSNAGAPPPAGASDVAANAEAWGDDEVRAKASSLTSMSTDDPASACGPADVNADDRPSSDLPAMGSDRARTSKAAPLARVCSLLSVKLPGC
jgi:hypothetical protein